MDKLNDYLKTLLSSCSEELRLEPDKNPYLVTDSRTTDLAHVPLMGTQISTMVFPLIPANVKSSLPHNSEVEFVHPHNLGNFNFLIQKSPAGFIVTVRPALGDSSGSISLPKPLPDVAPDYTTELGTPYLEAASEPEPAPEFETAVPPQISYDLESSSAAYDGTVSESYATASVSDLVFDDKSLAPEYIPSSNGGPEIEIVSVNDPEDQTVFSESANYVPPGRSDDISFDEVLPPIDPPAEDTIMEQNAYLPTEQLPDYSLPTQPASPPVSTEPAAAAFVPAAANPGLAAQMDDLFHKMADIGASDLHMSVSMPPMIRKDGKMATLESGQTALTHEAMRHLLK